jgi:hypothetical protein
MPISPPSASFEALRQSRWHDTSRRLCCLALQVISALKDIDQRLIALEANASPLR